MIYYRTLSVRKLWDKQGEEVFDRNKFIGRELFPRLINGLDTQKIEVIYGPRQSGKTTLFRFLIQHLNEVGIKEENIWYVNLDLVSDYSLFDKPENFLYLYDQLKPGERIYLFIDEIQRLDKPGLFLKGIYDSNRNIKVFVSGSASFEIKAKVKEFLTGRKRLHLVLPLSFREIVRSRGVLPPGVWERGLNKDTMEEWLKAGEVYREYLEQELEGVLLYGFYPAVYSLEDPEPKLEELHEIYNSYLKKDVYDYFNVERPEVFNNLVKVMANQAGNVVNISELCSLLSGSRGTVERYLGILRDTFITFPVTPFTSNKRSEVKYSNKIYFTDPGIRNLARKRFSPVMDRSDSGSMIENLIFVELQKGVRLLDEINYWRTKSKAEVDFVYTRGEQVIPIEVKTGSAKIGTLTRSFHSFIKTYNPSTAVFLNRDRFGILQVEQTTVYYIPVHWFLLTGIDWVVKNGLNLDSHD